jgi:predicted RNase H-like HicB family nuclease
MPLRVREVIQLLERNGWKELRSKGSHRHFKHPERPTLVTVPGNAQRYTQEGRVEMSEKRYPIVIERTATGFSAYSPDVPGCAAVGDTEEETRQSLRDALAAHFELMREIGDPFPEPSSSVDYVEVGA